VTLVSAQADDTYYLGNTSIYGATFTSTLAAEPCGLTYTLV